MNHSKVLLVLLIALIAPIAFSGLHVPTVTNSMQDYAVPAINTNFTIQQSVSSSGEVQLLISVSNPAFYSGYLNAYIFANSIVITNGSSRGGNVIALLFTVTTPFQLVIYHNATDTSGASPVGLYNYPKPNAPATFGNQWMFGAFAGVYFVSILITMKLTQRRERSNTRLPNEFNTDTFGDEVKELEKISNIIPSDATDEERKIYFKVLLNIGKSISNYYGLNQKSYAEIIEGKKPEEIVVGQRPMNPNMTEDDTS